MHLAERFEYLAEPQRVAEMLADPECVAARVRASGALDQQVDVVGGPDGAFTVTTRRHIPTDDIPASFRSFVGATLEVRQVDAWEAANGSVRHGTVVIEITGAPVRLSGTMRLEPTESGTVHILEGELKASIPLFGAAIEQATAEAIRSAAAAEHAVGRDWLAR